MLYECARNNPRAANSVGLLAVLYLHLGPFSRFVTSMVERQIVHALPGNGDRRLPPRVDMRSQLRNRNATLPGNQRRFSVAVEGSFGAEPEEAASGRSFR